MNPGSFDWAKCFICSPVWSCFENEKSLLNDVHFTLPKSCPIPVPSTCLKGNGVAAISLVEEAITAEFQENDADELVALDQPEHDITPISSPASSDNLENVSPSTGPWAASLLAKAGKLKVVEDDPKLRRSSRQKAQK